MSRSTPGTLANIFFQIYVIGKTYKIMSFDDESFIVINILI